MNRGDLASALLAGPYGSKPRPVLVIQSDEFRNLNSVTVLPLTSEVLPVQVFRVTVEPTSENGLIERSQIMVDKAHTVPRHRLGYVFGRAADKDMMAVNRALALFLGLS
jgi:mRNA interferase MazF